MTKKGKVFERMHPIESNSFFVSPHKSSGTIPNQVARFFWCMIRLGLCHGAFVGPLVAYISKHP